MDMAPFVDNDELPKHSTKLPTPDGAKLPKQRLSAAERLRRLEEAIAFLRQHLAAGPNLPKSCSKLPELQALRSGLSIGRKMCLG